MLYTTRSDLTYWTYLSFSPEQGGIRHVIIDESILKVYNYSYKRVHLFHKHIVYLQIMCRCSSPLETSAKEKISMFCHVEPTQVKCSGFVSASNDRTASS